MEDEEENRAEEDAEVEKEEEVGGLKKFANEGDGVARITRTGS